MIESYRHLCQLPDDDFAERKIPVSLQPGKEYKAFVEQETILGSKLDFPHRIDDLLEKRFGVSNIEKRKKCCGEILEISPVNSMEHIIDNALQEVVAEHILLTARGCKKSCVYGEIIFPDMNQICKNLLSDIATFMLSNFFSNNSIANPLHLIHVF